ncbi:hypothetical protein ElyMa_001191700 [Elysia marginata]|uniref:Uncharacterized protein n=1 Tax=Elysia marginata TaxID=1093978 RepID=A0AAV4I3Z9_9GAST|nr:hypothetical protein ElyMa_001191700 [Elysia marginata]
MGAWFSSITGRSLANQDAAKKVPKKVQNAVFECQASTSAQAREGCGCPNMNLNARPVARRRKRRKRLTARKRRTTRGSTQDPQPGPSHSLPSHSGSSRADCYKCRPSKRDSKDSLARAAQARAATVAKRRKSSTTLPRNSESPQVPPTPTEYNPGLSNWRPWCPWRSDEPFAYLELEEDVRLTYREYNYWLSS